MLIIWDVDGTIADSWPVYRQACARVTQRRGLPPADEKVLKLNFGHHELFDYGWGLSREAQLEIRYETVDEYYSLAKRNQLALFDWVRPLLDDTRRCNAKHAIATNRPLEALELFLRHHGMDGAFSFIAHGDLVTKGSLRHKPKPDLIHHALKEADALAQDAVMVGDSESDILAARAAGVKSVAVCWGMRDEDYLAAFRPDHLARTPRELVIALK